MHDTLDYFAKEPVHRKYHQDLLTFGPVYAFDENFMLPLSHDEVVHLKKSLFGKMPGDDWQKFANLRLLYTYQWVYPGKQLLFMGGELAQTGEWNANSALEWERSNQLHAGGHGGVCWPISTACRPRIRRCPNGTVTPAVSSGSAATIASNP